VLAVPRVFEKVYNGARQKAHADGKGGIFDRAERVAIAYSEALDQPPARLMLKAQHALFDRLVYTKLRDAMGGQCRDAHLRRRPARRPAGPLLPRHRSDDLRGVRLTETSPAAAVNLTKHIRIGTSAGRCPG
jgi:long-chain acyl-CoA synthetase